MEHMINLGSIVVKHKEDSINWQESIDPKIKEKIMINSVKGETLRVTPFINSVFGIYIGKTF